MWQPTNRIAQLVAFILCLESLAAAGSKANVPEWVRQAAAQTLGDYPAETKSVVLLDQTDYTVLGAGEFVEHSRNVVKILRPDGRESGELSVYLDAKDKLQSIHAWTIDKDGREYKVKDNDFTEVSGYPNWMLYADNRFITAKAPASLPGSIIALEYEVRRHEWINELVWFFQGASPAVQEVLTVQLPPGWEYRSAWPRGKPVEPVPLAANRWQWTLTNVPGIAVDRELGMPSFFSLAGRMSFSYFGPGVNSGNAATWRDVGRWYARLAEGRFSTTPEISAKAAALIAEKPDFASRLQTLTSFLQSEIRYVAVEIGVGGYQPHAASDVLRYRYGDCKDKVTLLKAMLQEAGIHSYYVLIDTHRGFVNPEVPSSWDNHAIIAIEVPDTIKGDPYPSVVTTKSGKHYIIFDPTDEYTPVGLLRSELQESYALLVTDDGGELIRTPLLPPEVNSLTRTGHFVLTSDGRLAGEVSEDRTGDSALHEREKLHYSDQRERTSAFERWLGRSIQGFTLEDVKIEYADQLTKDLVIHYKLTAPQYGQARGPLMLVRPRVLDQKSAYVEHKRRQYPLELEATSRQTDTYEIEIPSGYQVDDIPNPIEIDVGFARYRSRFEVEGNKLRYWREYIVRKLYVPAEKYDDWARLQGAIGADEAAAAVLKRVQ